MVWGVAIAIIALFVLIGFAPHWRSARWAGLAVYAAGWLFLLLYLIGGIIYLFGGG